MAIIAIDWAIGLFEGEGSIVFSRKQVYLSIQMTDQDVVKRFHKIVRVGNFRGPYKYKHKPTWVWACTRAEDVAYLLTEWLPYLGERRAKAAKKAIKLAKISSEYRYRFALVCKYGHNRTKENTSFAKNGAKRCLVCHASWERKRRQTKKRVRNGNDCD